MKTDIKYDSDLVNHPIHQSGFWFELTFIICMHHFSRGCCKRGRKLNFPLSKQKQERKTESALVVSHYSGVLHSFVSPCDAFFFQMVYYCPHNRKLMTNTVLSEISFLCKIQSVKIWKVVEKGTWVIIYICIIWSWAMFVGGGSLHADCSHSDILHQSCMYEGVVSACWAVLQLLTEACSEQRRLLV